MSRKKDITDIDYHINDIVQIRAGRNAGKLGKIESITAAKGAKPFLVYAIRVEKDDGFKYIVATDWQIRFVSREEEHQ